MMIIEPMNGIFWCLLATLTFIGVLLCMWLRKKEPSERKRAMYIIWGVLVVLFIVYRLVQSQDQRYLDYYQITQYNWWDALPLQLCYTSLILLPLALWKNWKYVMSFCFYITPLGAAMALFLPDPLFVGQSLLDPQIFLFYVLHGLIVITGVMLAPLGLFTPKFKMMLPTILLITVLTLVIHGINLLMRATVFPLANFFYTCETAGISLLDLCWGIVPIPYVYMLLLMPIVAVYITAVTGVYLLIQKIKHAKGTVKPTNG